VFCNVVVIIAAATAAEILMESVSVDMVGSVSGGGDDACQMFVLVAL
jgi:hypothetical protein